MRDQQNRQAAPQPPLSIVHPWDPWIQAIGGFDTCIDGILRMLPADWPVELIGCTADVEARPIGRWLDLEFAGRPIRYFAALSNRASGVAGDLPLSLRFVAACRRHRLRASGKIIEYHRFESGLAAARPKTSRTVYFFHNHPPEETRATHNSNGWRNLAGVHDALLLNRIRRASWVVTVDPRTPAWLASQLPDGRDRISCLPEWSDPSVFYPGTAAHRKENASRLRVALKMPAGCRIVLFAGRLEKQKDPLLLLQAFAALAEARSDVYLLMVGDGRMEGQVASAIRALAIAERTRRMAPVDRSRLADLFRSSDVVAIPSVFEGGPRSAFEALACGTPVVSFDCGQIGRVLERNPEAGVLVQDRSGRAFAAGLAKALAWADDPGLAARCAHAVREHVPDLVLAELVRRYREWELGDG